MLLPAFTVVGNISFFFQTKFYFIFLADMLEKRYPVRGAIQVDTGGGALIARSYI